MSSPPPPFARRLQLVTGKGGVGKTTVAVAIALDAAGAGRRPLLVELGHHASVGTVLGVEPPGHEPVEVGHGVHAACIDPDRAVVDYLAAQVRVRALARALASRGALSRFLAAAPAVEEVATFHRLAGWMAESWDPIVVDLGATGPAQMVLALPRVLQGLMGEGALRQLVDSFGRTVADPNACALHVVTTTSELALVETRQLVARRGDGLIAPASIIVNGMSRAPIAEEQNDLLEQIGTRSRDGGLDAFETAITLAGRATIEAHRAEARVADLARSGLPVHALPALADEPDLPALRRFGADLREGP